VKERGGSLLVRRLAQIKLSAKKKKKKKILEQGEQNEHD